MILSRYERMIARRYLLPGKGEAFIALVAGISLVAVMLGVGALIIVMSVMNGFRADLIDKIVGLNGHAVVQGYGGRLADWREVLAEAKATPGVTEAVPLIDTPLFASHGDRNAPVILRGMRMPDILSSPSLNTKIVGGSMADLKPGRDGVAVGSRLAEQLGGLRVGESISLISPEGQTTPFGTVPRIVSYPIVAIFEVGVFQFDSAYVVMPLANAQSFLLMGDEVGMIRVTTDDAETVGDTLAPLAPRIAGLAVIATWQSMNAELFEALAIERVAMFIVLSIIVLVAAFNILSSLIMLVRAKTRDIAILRTMGATRSGLTRIFVTVGSTIGLIGTALGVVLGFVFLFFRQGIINAIQYLTGQNLWDPSIRFLSELPSRTDPTEVTAIVLVSLLLCFLATLYPALKAAGTDPVQVLRYE